jgi:hypothetical protein
MPRILIVIVVAGLVAAAGATTAAVVATSGAGQLGGQIIITGDRTGMVERPSSGATFDHTERHATMTQQMRVADPDARMQTRMQADPMWQMMRSPAHIRAEEQRQAQIDRMLARSRW